MEYNAFQLRVERYLKMKVGTVLGGTKLSDEHPSFFFK